MQRRSILIGALTGLVAVAASISWRFEHADSEQAVITVLRKRLGYLQLKAQDLRRFARDLLAHGDFNRAKLRMMWAGEPVYLALQLSGADAAIANIRHGEERITTIFLLSTDFFDHGADVSREIHYLGYYARLRACGNPFATPISA